MDLVLKLPTKKYKEKIIKYKSMLLQSNSSMDGICGLDIDDIDVWLNKCKDWRQGKNLPHGYAPSTQYIMVRKSDDKIVGMLVIRHTLNDILFNYYGHIGYSIISDERQKGYGNVILKLGLRKCKTLMCGEGKQSFACLSQH